MNLGWKKVYFLQQQQQSVETQGNQDVPGSEGLSCRMFFYPRSVAAHDDNIRLGSLTVRICGCS
jgi:hypothetical protein